MRFAKMILTLAAALLCVTFATNARASEWNKKTVVTFNEAVEISGQVLPAGTYTMELLDNSVNRNVVLFYNADHTKLIATVFAINSYRTEPTDKTVMTFAERPRTAPMAMKSWFYPGESWGREFVK